MKISTLRNIPRLQYKKVRLPLIHIFSFFLTPSITESYTNLSNCGWLIFSDKWFPNYQFFTRVLCNFGRRHAWKTQRHFILISLIPMNSSPRSLQYFLLVRIRNPNDCTMKKPFAKLLYPMPKINGIWTYPCHNSKLFSYQLLTICIIINYYPLISIFQILYPPPPFLIAWNVRSQL